MNSKKRDKNVEEKDVVPGTARRKGIHVKVKNGTALLEGRMATLANMYPG